MNQVLKDLENRRGESPDTTGLRAAPIRQPRGKTGRAVVLVAAAVVAGISVLLAERLLSDRGALPEMTASAPVETSPAVAAPVEPEPSPLPEETVVAVDLADVEAVAPDEVVAPQETVAVAALTPTPVVAVAVEPPESAVRRTLVTETPAQRAGDSYTQGVRALSEGRRGTAETHFRAALAHDASYHDARLALANLLAGDGRARDAEAQLQEGLRLSPGHWPLAERYARLLFDRGDLAGAIGVLANAPPDVEAAPDYHALLAALLQRAGHHEAAADSYRALLSVRPDQGLWWMGLGISLEGVGRHTPALDAYSRAARDPRLAADVARFVRDRIEVLDRGSSR
ncbi:MAG: tetratricopeptide repeat protein [Gammaproteobacteria bacterium]